MSRRMKVIVSEETSSFTFGWAMIFIFSWFGGGAGKGAGGRGQGAGGNYNSNGSAPFQVALPDISSSAVAVVIGASGANLSPLDYSNNQPT